MLADAGGHDSTFGHIAPLFVPWTGTTAWEPVGFMGKVTRTAAEPKSGRFGRIAPNSGVISGLLP